MSDGRPTPQGGAGSGRRERIEAWLASPELTAWEQAVLVLLLDEEDRDG